jgi:hypothetical protein
MTLALLLIAVVVVNVPINAGILWLACRLLRVGTERRGISYPRAFGLTVTIFGIGWLMLIVVVVIVHQFSAAPLLDIAFWALVPLGVIVPLAILKWMLQTRWLRTVGVWIVWRVISLAQFLPVWMLVQPHLSDALGG